MLDNVAFHRSQRAVELVNAKGAWLLFPPPYSPGLNPIEMAFSKLKPCCENALLEPSMSSQTLGDICDLFSIKECRNFFKAAGYEAE